MAGPPGPGIPLHQRLTVRLTGGVIAVLLLIGCPFLVAFHKLHRAHQLEDLAEVTSGLGGVVVDSLRSSMLAGHPRLLDETIRSLSGREGIERVLLLDHKGRVRVSSDRGFDGKTLDRGRDATCAVCHGGSQTPPSSRTTVLQEGDRRVFRSMTTIPNEPRCHGCHDPATRINGILLMDLTLAAADRRFFADIGSTVGLGAIMVLLTIWVLSWLLRRMVHRPLTEMVRASERIVRGEFDARADVPGAGDFSVLASCVNRMTDHLAMSYRTVEAQRRELQEILDAIDDEVVVLDRDLRVVAANKAFTTAPERTGVSVPGRLCREASSTDWPCGSELPDGCFVRSVFRTGRLCKGVLTGPGPDGQERTVEIHASPLPDAEGRIVMAVEVRRDISERRQMEGMLAQSERLASLGLLASGLSHEINNPLAAIAASVEGLQRRLPREAGVSAAAAAEVSASLGRIAGEVQRSRSITDRLLRVARPPGTGRSLVDVNHVVEDIVGILQHDLNRRGITPRLDLTPALPPLVGDASSIGQIVMNLTLNAIQAMNEPGGNLRIETALDGREICIRVEDQGSGIAPEHLKRIYEPFFTTKPPGQGTGLGLFITHRLVTELGGSIEVRSEAGQGTAFSVRLPREKGSERS